MERLTARPAVYCGAMAAFFASLLWVDRSTGPSAQLVLGLAAWVVLAASCRPLAPERRAQVAVVVVVATLAELIGSIVWGVYRYRLGNLPLFVPPCHGLVYLTGLHLSQSAAARRYARPFLALALSSALVWALLGAAVLPRRDVAGLIGALTFAAFVVRGRNGAVYSGVFFAVAALELYGTAVGTWRWAEAVPGLGIPDGNPPSGAASGYVLFDIAALTLAPRLLRAARAARTRSGLAGPRLGRARSA